MVENSFETNQKSKTKSWRDWNGLTIYKVHVHVSNDNDTRKNKDIYKTEKNE